MAAPSQNSSIAHFFKPRSSIPAKRPSPSPDAQPAPNTSSKANGAYMRTPTISSRYKDVGSSPAKSPFGSGKSVKIPIRSPMPKSSQKPVRSFSSALSAECYDRTPRARHTDASPLRSPQPFSFADLPSSKQSVVKDGKVIAVKGSDSEDSDSLQSLEDIFGRKEEPNTSSSSPPELTEEQAEIERAKSLFLFANGRSQPLIGRSKLRELQAKEREQNFNISGLFYDHVDDAELEDNIAKAKEDYEATKAEEKLSTRQSELDRNILASIVGGGSDDNDLSRLMNAVERTEALTMGKTWSFFKPGCPRRSSKKPTSFPDPDSVDEEREWYESLDDREVRQRSYISGYVSEAWASKSMPVDVANWTLDNLLYESDDDMRRSHVQALKNADPTWARVHVDTDRIQRMFSQMGATDEALTSDNIKATGHVTTVGSAPEFRYLISAVEALTDLAPHLEVTAVDKLLTTMLRLTLDVQVMNDFGAAMIIEDCLSELMEGLERYEYKEAMMNFVSGSSSLEESTLQAQLLKYFPATSRLSARIRIAIAQRYLFREKSSSPSNLDDLKIDIDQIREYLESGPFDSTFRSGKRPDYTHLSSLVHLIDVAVADGGRPAIFDSQKEEVVFNRKIDALADRVKSIFASIADTGASHMRRTEAKEALQALHYRLLYAVRTEPRPKKNVFGGRSGDEYRSEERSKNFMQGFLAKTKDRRHLKEVDIITKAGSSQASKTQSEILIKKHLRPTQ